MADPRRKKKKKKKSRKGAVIAVIAVIVVLAAALFALHHFGLWGITDGKFWIGHYEDRPDDYNPIAYIKFEGKYLEINKDGYALRYSEDKPEGLPELTGIEFEGLAELSKLVCDSPDNLSYAIRIIRDLQLYSLKMDRIAVAEEEENEIIMYAGKIKILMGKNKGTDQKINDLSNFYDQIEGLDGTLDMKEVSDGNMGYTFKRNK